MTPSQNLSCNPVEKHLSYASISKQLNISSYSYDLRNFMSKFFKCFSNNLSQLQNNNLESYLTKYSIPFATFAVPKNKTISNEQI
jgi:hypothetical protein